MVTLRESEVMGNKGIIRQSSDNGRMERVKKRG